MKLLPAITSIGGYPLIYISKNNNVYCNECASKYKDKMKSEIHWEGEPHICNLCTEEIKSAYGIPGEE